MINWEIFSPRDCQRELLNIFGRRSWDGKFDVILLSRGSVTGCVIIGTRDSQMMTPDRTIYELALGLYALVFKYVRISTRNHDVIVGTSNGICFIDVFYDLDDPEVIDRYVLRSR